MDIKDIAIRAVKTFVQAFLGVFLTALCGFLKDGFSDLPTFKKALAPVVAAALSAGICAVWNSVLTLLQTDEKEIVDEKNIDENPDELDEEILDGKIIVDEDENDEIE